MSSWTKEGGEEGGEEGGGNGTGWRLRHHQLFACILIGHAATSYVQLYPSQTPCKEEE